MTTTTDAPARLRHRTLCGNLTRNPELRYSAKGTAWATCGLAANRTNRLDDGTFEEQPPEFYDLVCFGDLAENVAQVLAKGTRVVCVGKLEADTWTQADGTERATHKLVCDDIGASLRFATVKVTRTERRPGGYADDPAAGPLDDYDEEPF
jgi:single-strand DNA-binding protein